MQLSWLDILTLTAFPCFIAIGQILFKITASSANGKPLVEALGIFVVQPVFYFALCIYACGTLFWLWLLTRYPLTLAYPFAAIALVVVPFLDVVLFGARANFSYWCGLALIVIGVVLVTRAQGR